MENCQHVFQLFFRNVKQRRAGPDAVEPVCKLYFMKPHAQRLAPCQFFRTIAHSLRGVQHGNIIPLFHKTQTVAPAAAACIQNSRARRKIRQKPVIGRRHIRLHRQRRIFLCMGIVIIFHSSNSLLYSEHTVFRIGNPQLIKLNYFNITAHIKISLF